MCGRYILNILLGKCDAIERKSPRLIATVEMKKTNSENIVSEIIDRVVNFLKSDIKVLQKIRLLLSDGAPYAIKTGKVLKELIPNLKHITCICHALHNLAETIRDQNKIVDDAVVFLKRSLLKNRTKKSIFLKLQD